MRTQLCAALAALTLFGAASPSHADSSSSKQCKFRILVKNDTKRPIYVRELQGAPHDEAGTVRETGQKPDYLSASFEGAKFIDAGKQKRWKYSVGNARDSSYWLIRIHWSAATKRKNGTFFAHDHVEKERAREYKSCDKNTDHVVVVDAKSLRQWKRRNPNRR